MCIILLVCVKENQPIEDEIAEESGRNKKRHRRTGMIYHTSRYSFGEKVEERDARDRPGRKAKDKV